MLDQAKSKGAKGDGFDKLEQRLNEAGKKPLEALVSCQEAQPEQPNILDTLKLDQAIKLAKKKAKEGDPEEAKRIYQDILTKFPKNKRASDGLKGASSWTCWHKHPKFRIHHKNQQQSLINLYSQGQLKQALQASSELVAAISQVMYLVQYPRG